MDSGKRATQMLDEMGDVYKVLLVVTMRLSHLRLRSITAVWEGRVDGGGVNMIV